MFEVETELAGPPPRPRTVTVLGLLAGVALVFSYLAAYAISDALVSADVMRPWSPNADPRPRWMATGFVLCMVTFVCFAVVARFLSRQQLRQIDAMGDDEATPG
jgi:hypothetical protein